MVKKSWLYKQYARFTTCVTIIMFVLILSIQPVDKKTHNVLCHDGLISDCKVCFAKKM